MNQWLTWTYAQAISDSGRDIIGYVASLLVLATFSMNSMRSLRATAVCSNVAFICYALVTRMHPVLVLHSILLPVNIVRLTQIELSRFRRRVQPSLGVDHLPRHAPVYDEFGSRHETALRVE